MPAIEIPPGLAGEGSDLNQLAIEILPGLAARVLTQICQLESPPGLAGEGYDLNQLAIEILPGLVGKGSDSNLPARESIRAGRRGL